ncbi:neogenin-like isoform X3 [Phymastichus coffea]|uniref:neogenin-like isoform X3 n=1 Tax=Phymastichus coffea TaxID=108790 RepID=UPI00273B71C3|nr:neogenin-like isoform X3 [Phymastichus coffea]
MELSTLVILGFLFQLASSLQFSYEPQDLLVEEGKPARLDCQAQFNSIQNGGLQEIPVIRWRTDDGQLINFIGDKYRTQLANGSLLIRSIDSETNGKYQCLASIENVGAIASRIATIKLGSLESFDREPQDIMVYPGQIAYLSCRIAGSNKHVKISWLKDDQPLMLDESRMSVLPSGALEIFEALPHDVGSYMCNASRFSHSQLSNKAQLTLQSSEAGEMESAPIFIARPSNQRVLEKSSATLECAANGKPKPQVFWLKDGVSIDLASLDSRYETVGASSLMIKDVTEEDKGLYQCRAKNDIDSLDAIAELTVEVPPRFIKRPQDKEAIENQDLEFECEVYGQPTPVVTWLKNGERIQLSNYWQLTNGYNLRINGLLSIDAGIFQCMAKNSAGSVQASARLIINQLKKERKGGDEFYGRKGSGSSTRRRLGVQQLLSNSTWQHPSTLLGHTSSAYTFKPPLSIPTSDDSVDLLIEPFAVRPFSYEPVVADSQDGLNVGESLSVPMAPRNLSAAFVSTRSVTLMWKEPHEVDVSNYLVYYRQDGFERERIERTTMKETTVTINSLQPGTNYIFRTVANVSNVLSASSNVIRLTTESEPNVPSHPLKLKGWPTSHESIALSWNEPISINGQILSYIVTYAHGDSEESTVGTNSTTHELFNLKPYREYSVWVQGVNENGPGASTGELKVRTFSAAPSNSPNVTLEAVSATSIIVRWEPPIDGLNGIIIGYKIRYRPTNRRSHPIVVTTEGNQHMYVINRLEKNVGYQVRVCVFNVNGTGPWSDWSEIETHESDLSESVVPNSPTNLRIKAMSDSILVWWGPPKDQSIKVRGYVLTWGKGIPDEYNKVLDDKQRYYTIENLESNSEYVITLRAKNEAGEGIQVYENVRTIEKMPMTESPAPLTPPVGLKAIVMSPTTVVLHWTDMTLPKNQFITDNRYYVVRYTSYHRSSIQRYKYFNATDLHCTIQDLKPNTEHEFTVKAVKGRRESPWSMVVMNKTMELISTPQDLKVEGIDNHPKSVLLRWTPPKQANGEINGYVISYTTDNTKIDREWKATAVVGDKTEYVLTADLQPHTTYYFRIQARHTKDRYGPFSTTIAYKTPTTLSGQGWSSMLIYIIIGCFILVLTAVSVIFLFICCRRNPNPEDTKKGYLKDSNIKTNIKPPDLWIHHDQMELKALEKNIANGETSLNAITSNTLPRSGNSEYNQDNVHVNSSSLDKRTYIPSYMAIATATPIVNSSLSQQTIHSSCSDVPSIRANYPRTVAQYSLSRAHITLEPTPESSPDSCNLISTYEPLQTQLYSSGGIQSYNATTQYPPNSYEENSQMVNTSTAISETTCGTNKRLQGHPLKSFSVPAPPPQSAPSTPAQQKHGVSQMTIRPSLSASPYKKNVSSNQLVKNRLTSVTNTNHTPEELERLKGTNSSPTEPRLENTGDVKRVGTLSPSVLRPQLLRRELAHCRSGRGLFCGPIVDVFLATRFSNDPITMNNIRL